MVTKKPKKDEVVTLEGIVNDITPTLIRVDTHNIAVLGDTVNRMRGLEVSLGDTVKITYKNGILLTIELMVKKPKEMHIDKPETSSVATLPDDIPSENETKPGISRDVTPSKSDVHIQKYPKCRFCGADDVKWVAPIGDCWSRKEIRLVFTNLYQCASCKLVYTDPRLE